VGVGAAGHHGRLELPDWCVIPTLRAIRQLTSPNTKPVATLRLKYVAIHADALSGVAFTGYDIT
jgi:hypothetical protein